VFNDMIRAHDLSIWPVGGLLIFFTFMIGVFTWTAWPGRKAELDKLRYAALEDQSAPRGTPRGTAKKEPA
jgi:cbb3-type cytochrome oxidase subunit 3